ncbi:MaoC family dehydratase [Oleiharenicola lentus]|nr:MaoC family dehydratase [Oleiharenicola lentus]
MLQPPNRTSTMLYFEDLKPGDRFNTPEHTVTEEEIVEFARRHDPQPFHTDAEAAKGTFFRGLVASGWHTAAVSMGLMVRGEMPLRDGVIGQGVDNLRWPRPVRPGDRLRVVMEVAGLEPHPVRLGFGNLLLRCRTLNQDGKAVQEMTANLLIARRPSA